jgi:hypothetical protein
MIKYYRVDNTGWTNGVSWFRGEDRFNTFAEAIESQREMKWDDDSVLWRIAEVTIVDERLDDKHVAKRIIEERYLYLT